MNKLKNINQTKVLSIMMLIFSVLYYVVMLLACQDNDMFHEVMTGRDILAGNFNTVSHVNNFPMLHQHWLYVAVLAIFDKLGYFGHILLVFIQNTILMAVSYKFICLKTNDKKLAIIGSWVSLLFCAGYLINVRPQIITAILLVIELIILTKYEQDNRKAKYLFWLIPLMVVAANFHQGIFLYHILVLVPFYVIDLKKSEFDWKLVCITPIYIACSICTPYGINGPLYVFRSFLSNSFKIFKIQELQPLTLISDSGIFVILMAAVTILLIHFKRSNIYINCYSFGICILSLTAIRHSSVMFIPLLYIFCAFSFEEIKSFKFLNHIELGLFACMILLLMIYADDVGDIRSTNAELVEVIEDKDAKIFNSAIDLGGLLEYNDCTHVYMDSRIEAYSEDLSGVKNVIYDMYAVIHGYSIDKSLKSEHVSNEYILDIVDDYDYVVSRYADYVNRLLVNNDEYIKLYEDGQYLVWQHVK